MRSFARSKALVLSVALCAAPMLSHAADLPDARELAGVRLGQSLDSIPACGSQRVLCRAPVLDAAGDTVVLHSAPVLADAPQRLVVAAVDGKIDSIFLTIMPRKGVLRPEDESEAINVQTKALAAKKWAAWSNQNALWHGIPVVQRVAPDAARALVVNMGGPTGVVLFSSSDPTVKAGL